MTLPNSSRKSRRRLCVRGITITALTIATAPYLVVAEDSPAVVADKPVASAAKPPSSIFAECRMVIVPQKSLFPIIADFSDDTKAEAGWERVEKAIESGEATLAADLVVKGATEQPLVGESAEEQRFPTEFEPPQLPQSIPAENATESLKAWPHVGLSPISFETQKVGESMELLVHASPDGSWLDVDLTPQHVRLLRWDKFDAGKLADGTHLSIEQPAFQTMKDVVNLRIRNGHGALIGVHKVPDLEGRFELFLFRATVTPAK